MVDSIGSALGAGHGYASYSSAGRQSTGTTTSITVETDQETFVAQINQGGKKETLSYTSYSESVTIDVKSGAAGSDGTPGNSVAGQAQDGQQALATIEQTAAEAHDFLKNDAKAKLQIALNELKLLKLLGNSPAGAKEAAKLAKQIADAATEYAQGGGASPADSADASSAAADASAAATTADPSTAAQAEQAVSGGSTASGSAQGVATGATPADQDPFYQEVQAAIAELKKYLRKTLPALELAPDRKTRELGKKVEKSFNESLDQIAQAEAQFNAESAGGGSDTAALGGTDSAASAAASVVAAAYQPVNISA